MPLYTDPILSKLFARIWTDPEVFDEPEREQAIQIMFQTMKALESVHFHHLNGMLEPGLCSGWRTLFLHYINTPGIHRYWALRQDVYSPAFQDWTRENATGMSGTTVRTLGTERSRDTA